LFFDRYKNDKIVERVRVGGTLFAKILDIGNWSPCLPVNAEHFGDKAFSA